MLKVKVGLSCVAVVLLCTGGLTGSSFQANAQGRSVGNITPVATNSQLPGTHRIVWDGIVTLKSSTHPKALSFEGAGITRDGLPVFLMDIPDKALEKIQLTNTTYEPLTAAEAALVPSSYSAAQPEVISEIGLEMGNPVTIVTFVPLRINPATGQKEKLVGFSYTSQPARKNPQARSAGINQFSNSSVLSTGAAFYKMAVTNSGMYKIDRQFLASLGLNPDQVDPNKLQVYGNGGGILPQLNSANRPNDLVENPVTVSHNGNSVFEEGEYLLFYGQGPHTWRVSSDKKQFVHTQNIYSDTTYYFITAGNSNGKRVFSKASLPGTATLLTYSDERAFLETEAENYLKSGRNWYGEKFNSFSPTRDFTFPATGLKPGSTAIIAASLLNAAPDAANFQFLLNGTSLGNLSVSPIGVNPNNSYGSVGVKGSKVFSREFPSPPSDFSIRITYSGGGSSTQGGYLDFLEVNYQRQLRLTDNQLSFRRRLELGAQNIGTFKLTNTTPNTVIWDVTHPRNPIVQLGNNAFGEFTFTTDSLAVREFIAFDGSDLPKPVAAGRVAQQNLHALNLNGDLDLLIVAHPKFMAAAEQLAQHRRTNDGLNVAIVTPMQVYNEFSSGAQDITAIRDMMRMVYNRRASGKRINLLLFGDSSYDYKSRKKQNTNYVPIYESKDDGSILHNIDSHSSDDYYGFLDDNEGDWSTSFNDHLMDIGVGRLPVNTVEDAQAVVKKLINYDSPSTFGKWRNSVVMVADDEDGNRHFEDAEIVAKEFELANNNINTKKVYLDAYQQVSVASGQRSPQMQEQLNQAVEQGALLVNFAGHGSETGWMHERVLDVPQIQQWDNADKLAFFVTATCEFGRYDDPDRNSGGEYILISPNGGGIGLLTTTRPVYSNSNLRLNEEFARCVFKPIDGEMPRLGDVLRITKNKSIDFINNRNFALLGDPSARLAYPEKTIRITKINGQPTTVFSQDTLRALSIVSIEGEVVDGSGNVLTDFNQQLQATVYEKTTTIPTFGDKNTTPKQFKARQNVIYDGLSTVSNGTFKFQFVVPKDINYSFGLGKISMYSNTLSVDAAGNHSKIVIGGSDPNAANDATAPEAKLFMNDESFVFGGTTGKEATFLAKLFDESGINTAGIGIGHELKATLDEGQEFVLNEYYTADVNSYKSGTIRFPLKDLENGPHSIKLKVWDSHNNSKDEYLEFVVVNDASLALDHVLNYPNPFAQQTTFHFDHNRAGDPLEVQVQVFTVSGRLVKTISQQANESFTRSHVKSLTWDGRDDYNDKLAKGVYVYKVSVRSLRDGSKAHQYQKLVILN